MYHFAHKAVAVGTALMLTMSLALPAFAGEPPPPPPTPVGPSVVAAQANTQTSSSTVQATQTGSAVSGDATATTNATASSGDAIAKAEASQTQITVQAAGTVAGAAESTGTTAAVSVVNQDSTQKAQTGQNVSAASGNAVATGTSDSSADASTGKAVAVAKSDQLQVAAQVAGTVAISKDSDNGQVTAVMGGTGSNVGTGTNQTIDQVAAVQQTSAAKSGNATATASGGSSANAESDKAVAVNKAAQAQITAQVALTAAVGIDIDHTSVIAAQASDQSATGIKAELLQDAKATSGAASATATKKGDADAYGDEAIAKNEAAQVQAIAQVAATVAAAAEAEDSDVIATTNTSQTITGNLAQIGQGATATSGDATATADGKNSDADAYGGDARATNEAEQFQANAQLALNAAVAAFVFDSTLEATAAVDQSSSDDTCLKQTADALAGSAVATAKNGGEADADGGDAEAENELSQIDASAQVAANIGVLLFSGFTDASANQSIMQTNSQFVVADQSAKAKGGNATATGDGVYTKTWTEKVCDWGWFGHCDHWKTVTKSEDYPVEAYADGGDAEAENELGQVALTGQADVNILFGIFDFDTSLEATADDSQSNSSQITMGTIGVPGQSASAIGGVGNATATEQDPVSSANPGDAEMENEFAQKDLTGQILLTTNATFIQTYCNEVVIPTIADTAATIGE